MAAMTCGFGGDRLPEEPLMARSEVRLGDYRYTGTAIVSVRLIVPLEIRAFCESRPLPGR
jgi:hypothetical protein